MMGMLEWVFEQLRGDVVDLNFIMSDLKDIELTEDERSVIRWGDAAAADTVGQVHKNDVPIGKRVY